MSHVACFALPCKWGCKANVALLAETLFTFASPTYLNYCRGVWYLTHIFPGFCGKGGWNYRTLKSQKMLGTSRPCSTVLEAYSLRLSTINSLDLAQRRIISPSCKSQWWSQGKGEHSMTFALWVFFFSKGTHLILGARSTQRSQSQTYFCFA